MKFFRTSAPGLVALAVLLCIVPAFASPALDTPDADAPKIGEVLNDDFTAPSVPDNGTPAVPDTVPDADIGGTDTGPAPAVTTPDTDSSEAPDTSVSDAPESGEDLTDGVDAPAPAGDGTVSDDSPADMNGNGAGDGIASPGDGVAGTIVSGSTSGVKCSGAEVTVNLDDREYVSVTNVGGSMFSASAADTSTLPGLLRAMFGTYTPKMQTVTTYFDGKPLATSMEYVPGIAGMDMEWIASVVLFGIVVYCLFRLLGGMVR